LAYVFDSSGNSIDVQLVAGGFAKAWTRDGQHRDVLVDLESSANSNGAGCIWAEGSNPSQLPEQYWPDEEAFLRAWGARVPWVPLPASRSGFNRGEDTNVVFQQYVSLWVVEMAFESGEMSKDSFAEFMARPEPDIPLLSQDGFSELFNHSERVSDSFSWLTNPQSLRESMVGCTLGIKYARRRLGASFEIFGPTLDYCGESGVWGTYLASQQEPANWIEFLSARLFGAQAIIPTKAPEPTPTPTIGVASQEYVPSFGMLKPGSTPRAPSGALDTSKTYAAVFKTDAGEFTVLLFDDEAPLTVENFINLVTIGFYEGTMFHRVIPGFMAQGGDPNGNGTGGPGYSFRDEIDANRRHDEPGILSMANSGRNTNGSQFFITFAPTTHLDGAHSVFGEVIDGLDNVLDITTRDPGTATVSGDKIKSIVIRVR